MSGRLIGSIVAGGAVWIAARGLASGVMLSGMVSLLLGMAVG
jgi:hypothetical protein